MKKLVSIFLGLSLALCTAALFGQAPPVDQPKAEKKGHKTNNEKSDHKDDRKEDKNNTKQKDQKRKAEQPKAQ
jgi:hypothetical protein